MLPSSPEQVINQALLDCGNLRRIADIYDGSAEAVTALELYGQARDELLRATDWSFSRKVLALTLLKGPPPDGGYSPTLPWSTIYPYPGFLYEYAYPSDCLDLRSVIAPPSAMPDLDPVPALYRIDNDPVPIVSGSPPSAAGPPQKVILCNQTAALAVYRASITDPLTWEPGFVAALVSSLAKKFAKAFSMPPGVVKEEEGNELATTSAAANVRG